MSNGYTEDHLVEQPAVQLMQHELGWEVVNCYGERGGGVSALGRDRKPSSPRLRRPRREVVLVSRLMPALQRLNPDLPAEAIEGAVEEICRDRTALSLAEANREIDKLLKQGVKVSFPDPDHGGQRVEVVRVIDWEAPENNDFLLGSQFWVAGELYLKRPDLVGFVNGLPSRFVLSAHSQIVTTCQRASRRAVSLRRSRALFPSIFCFHHTRWNLGRRKCGQWS